MEQEGMQSVTRIFSIIEKIAEKNSGLGITEISRATNLPKSTVFRTVNALLNNNYLTKCENEKYKLGYKFIAIAKSYTTKLDLREIAGPYIQRLVHSLNVTGHIAVRQGDNAVYIEKIQPYSYICMYSDIGKTIEMYCSGLGKSLLLGLTKGELESYLERTDFVKYTDNTLNKADLVKELLKAQNEGIVYDNAEHEEGVYCMSVPIFDYNDNVIGAISITSADRKFFENANAVDMLIQSGKEISRQFGK